MFWIGLQLSQPLVRTHMKNLFSSSSVVITPFKSGVRMNSQWETTVSHYWTCHVLWCWMVMVRPTIQPAIFLLSFTYWLRIGWCCFSPWGDIFRNITSVFLHSVCAASIWSKKTFSTEHLTLWGQTDWWQPQTLLSNSWLGLPPTVWWLDLCCVWAGGSFIRPGHQQLRKASHSAFPWRLPVKKRNSSQNSRSASHRGGPRPLTLHWICISRWKTKTERESVWEGNSVDFIRTKAALFEIGKLCDGGLPSETTTRCLHHRAAFEVSLWARVRVSESAYNPGRCDPDTREYDFLRPKQTVSVGADVRVEARLWSWKQLSSL